ncbi:MAG: type transport system permease protein [Frankiaceae bacterium]|nr:type transport system permease protein [Frankiaceae bacterium]
MSDLGLLVRLIGYEQKIYWRNAASAFFTFGFPLAFFFIFATIFGSRPNGDLGGVKSIQYYTPSILGYAIMSACFVNIALMLATRRENGILKRLRGTPLPAWALVGGIFGSSIIVSGLLTGVSLGFARIVYGVSLPAAHLPPVLVTILFAALAFCAMGVAVSALIPNAEAGPAIINLPFFILVFLSGTYFPVTGNLARVSGWFPLRPFIQALYRPFNPHATGSLWSWGDLRIILVWGVVGAALAVRWFRWQPPRR